MTIMTEAHQYDLFAPPPERSDPERLLAVLSRAGGWLKTPDILRLDPRLGSPQRVRAALEHCGGQVISGVDGYRHLDRATTDEIRHFIAAQRSRARKILLRCNQTRRLAHARIA